MGTLSKNDLMQIRRDMEELKKIFRTNTPYVSYGLLHVLQKKDLFEHSPFFGWQITPSPRMNTRGPSMRYFTSIEGDLSIPVSGDVMYYKNDGLRAYIFLSKSVDRMKIEEYGKTLRGFGLNTMERAEYRTIVSEEYCKDMLIEIEKALYTLEVKMGIEANKPIRTANNKSLF